MSAPDLTPSQLLGWHGDPLALSVAAALLLGYVRLYRRRGGFPAWRVMSFTAGLLLMLTALQSYAAQFTVNSMALYMLRMMLLAEFVPPLLLLGIPPAAARSRSRILNVLLDPWVALSVWTAIIVIWNLPFTFSASVVNNTAATLLPGLYLLGGTLSWALTLGRTPVPHPDWARGLYGLIASAPMMIVGLVWLFSQDVLYAPYVGALCLWNLTPLDNQQIAGVIMLTAGVPLMLAAFWELGRQLQKRLWAESPGFQPWDG